MIIGTAQKRLPDEWATRSARSPAAFRGVYAAHPGTTAIENWFKSTEAPPCYGRGVPGSHRVQIALLRSVAAPLAHQKV